MPETHYLSFDPDAVWERMTEIYFEEGGDVLYPGDEKEMLLRAVQKAIVEAFAGVDTALRMATLRYAVEDYLDLFGENRGCERLNARAAEAVVEITFRNGISAGIIPTGAALTADGELFYKLKDNVTYESGQSKARATIVCVKEGTSGNGLKQGTQMQFLIQVKDVQSVIAVQGATGGQERESDDKYRERIRTFGLSAITTGPKMQYESRAMQASGEILDALAENGGAGQVNIYLLMKDGADESALIETVKNTLDDKETRPLTDSLNVAKAEEIPYTLNVDVKADSNLTSVFQRAANDYKAWQDTKIGRHFNPDMLVAALYKEGAQRVTIRPDSRIGGATVQYTETPSNKRLKGIINLAVVSA